METAKKTELLEAMKNAGVTTVCIGYESPIDEDLKAMHKGFLSRNMVEWTKILRQYFWVHGMFIFGYPTVYKLELSVSEMIKRFKDFIREIKINSIQVLHPVPAVGTKLRERLEREGRIFPLSIVPWSKYDGNYSCFIPENMSIKEFQETPIKLMRWFYSPFSFFKVSYRTIILPAYYFVTGWRYWYRGWRRDVVRSGGYLLVRQWQKKQKAEIFLSRLENYKKNSGDSYKKKKD